MLIIFCPCYILFIYLNSFSTRSCDIFYILFSDVAVIWHCVRERRDEGEKAVSVMCVIVFMDISFHQALRRCKKKDHNLENENFFLFLTISILSTYGEKGTGRFAAMVMSRILN